MANPTWSKTGPGSRGQPRRRGPRRFDPELVARAVR